MPPALTSRPLVEKLEITTQYVTTNVTQDQTKSDPQQAPHTMTVQRVLKIKGDLRLLIEICTPKHDEPRCNGERWNISSLVLNNGGSLLIKHAQVALYLSNTLVKGDLGLKQTLALYIYIPQELNFLQKSSVELKPDPDHC